MARDTPMSAIFFGPPGTSKTQLARAISDYLGWPRLVVDPSYFVKTGMDNIQAQADKLFSMLSAAERIVVLLDEFDEMVILELASALRMYSLGFSRQRCCQNAQRSTNPENCISRGD